MARGAISRGVGHVGGSIFRMMWSAFWYSWPLWIWWLAPFLFRWLMPRPAGVTDGGWEITSEVLGPALILGVAMIGMFLRQSGRPSVMIAAGMQAWSSIQAVRGDFKRLAVYHDHGLFDLAPYLDPYTWVSAAIGVLLVGIAAVVLLATPGALERRIRAWWRKSRGKEPWQAAETGEQGTAKWLDPTRAVEAYGTGELIAGVLADKPEDAATGPLLRWNPEKGHMLVQSGSRGGKTTAAVLPTLLEWRGSVVGLDVKNELGAMIGRHRRDNLGQEVIIIGPGAAGLNILDWLDPNNESIIENAFLVSTLLLTEEGVIAESSQNRTLRNGART